MKQSRAFRFIALWTVLVLAPAGLVCAEVSDHVLPTPADLWKKCRENLIPLEFKIEKDEIVLSDSIPGMKLRRVDLKFYSQEIEGRKWGHPCVVFMPTDSEAYKSPDKRGKVVIVGQRSWDGTGPWRNPFLGNYGEPIASFIGYPTMIFPVPGEYDDMGGQEISIGFLSDYRRKTQNPIDHPYFRLAVPYLRALDVMAGVLEIDKKDIQAVIGGHSKRATSAYVAAAVDPERISGVVFMGNESTWGSTRELPWKAVSPAYLQQWVKTKVLYLGATNEDGYRMYNINRIQKMMGGSWAIEYIPNYRHASMSEKHFLDWRIWVSHVFDERPLTKIIDLSYKEVEEGFRWGGREVEAGTLFRARIDYTNKIIQVKVWYVYCDDEPFWRDLIWHPEFMVENEEGCYEGYVKGKLPDAWLVEVKDTALEYPGYLTSLPQDITGKPTETWKSRGSRSRLWGPKKNPNIKIES